MMSARQKLDRARLPGQDGDLELSYPERLVEPVAWLGHVPFAMWLVAALKPRMIVELGVHTGNSYCAFLQSVQALGLDARCFGIDHWQGDEHAGYYGDELYEEFRGYHDGRYGAFSTLIRSSFDEARPYFSDGSIDLLHIDGFHTLDAVSADFAAWLPKVSSRGVVLFHDINVRERGFGIWQFWETISSRYPHFAFKHSHGLGVAYVGSEPLSGSLELLFAAKSGEESERVRTYFARLGTSVVERRMGLTLAADLDAANRRGVELTVKLEAIQSELIAAQSDLNASQSKLEASHSQIGVLKDEIEAAQADLKRERAQVQALVAESEQAKKRITALEASLHVTAAEREATRSELNTEKANAEALAAKLHTIDLHAKIQKSLARQRIAITSRLQQQLFAANQELLVTNAEKSSYEQQLLHVLRSKSWRMTEAPRRAYLKLRRLFSSNRGGAEQTHD